MMQLDLLSAPHRHGPAKRPPALEFETHIALADTLRKGGVARGWLWTHFPAGEKRSEQTAARLKRMGLKPGFSDFLFIAPDGRHHWLELKRGKSPLSDDQKDFAAAMSARGVPHVVARSYKDAIAALRQWGAIAITVMA